MMGPHLKSVLNMQKKRTTRENAVKEKIINSIKEKINNYVSHGQVRCLYRVPVFLIGHSLYDNDTMVLYVAQTFQKEGFYVEVGGDNNVLISWDIKDVQKVQKSKKKSTEKFDSLIGMMNLKK